MRATICAGNRGAEGGSGGKGCGGVGHVSREVPGNRERSARGGAKTGRIGFTCHCGDRGRKVLWLCDWRSLAGVDGGKLVDERVGPECRFTCDVAGGSGT